ncbi:uncharacterized protein KY384_000133 [Bacidia gigantensis]|uniref:uncharacterized protein n=1 Tax=Bacidia gigantensis TaxID=2732470 RepID=UPI001D044F1A|nr:uncharacterized protein KY384_000133 [Bacidia gigantensis]KAG8526140.1 hypothetical protein KY384_000133 [Bacidia gigantensis]
MASTYNIEPPPTAKVLLLTTSGDLLLELFAKQCPLASRNFLQHCLNGYYDDTIFHRLLPNFILQGGDPTGTGEGGESIYEKGKGFEDEFHSRLKWNRRGLLGMANEGRPNTNGSHFFLSLGDECRQLEGRNTMFGRLVGDTIFNLLKMAEAEVQEGLERPMYPTRVTGAEILVNPFEDMVRRDVKRVEVAKEERKEGEKKKAKKKGGKQLLSFGDEEGGVEVMVRKEKGNPRLIDVEDGAKGATTTSKADERAEDASNGHLNSTTRKPEKKKRRRSSASPSPPPPKKAKPEVQLPLPQDEEPSRSVSTSPEAVERMTTLLDKTNAQIAELKNSMKRNVQTASTNDAKPKSALEQMIPATAVRGKKRKQGDKGVKQTLDLLITFRSKLESADAEVNDVPNASNGHTDTKLANSRDTDGENAEEAALCDLHFIANCESCKSWDEHSGDAEDDDLGDGWMSHALSFEKDRMGKDLSWKKKQEDDLVVIDPREKSKGIKEEMKAKKMARMGGGGRAWDQK